MSDYWLVSVPLDKISSTSVEKLKHSVTKAGLASCSHFSIPELKVGVLDSLLRVSDDLSKLDSLTESVIRRTCQCMKEVMEPNDEKVSDTRANGDPRGVAPLLKAYPQSLSDDLETCVSSFQWDKAKYPTALPLPSLTLVIHKEVTLVEAELRSRASAYSSVSSDLQRMERTLSGKLLTRCLSDVVRREDLVFSEYLTTLLVIVSRGSYKQWENSYETMSECVVPRSSRMLYEDREGGIFTVSLFKRSVCEFKAKAQKSKFILREYSFDVEESKQQETRELRVHQKEQHGVFACWLKMNLREVFITWIHIKALRVFVESVLRYGLPVKYQTLLLRTDKKHSKKLRGELSSLFSHLDPTASLKDVSCDIPGLCQQEHFSSVCFHIASSVLDSS